MSQEEQSGYMRKTLLIIITLSSLVIGGVFGWIGNVRYVASTPSHLTEIRENSLNYHYINPLLYIDSTRAAPEYNDIKKIIQTDVDAAKGAGTAKDVSVYFRDLNQGKWTGVNEQQTYEPGSMLKVLTLIAYLKDTENDGAVISKTLNYHFADDSGQYYKPEDVLSDGDHNIEELLEQMIIYSDNTAAKLLLNENKKGFAQTYATLRLPDISATSTTGYMSPASYSQIFRSLYNATYLGNTLSERALYLLAHTTFTKGLVAGTPPGTIIAHKFGENTTTNTDGTVLSHELHDCGIVYYPAHPYFLCVMTRGSNFPGLESVISGISKDVYTAVDAKNASTTSVTTK